VRVTVVGASVFTAAIHSQHDEATRDDCRRKGLLNLPHRVHQLPDEEALRCCELVRRLGLQFGAIDLVYTPESRYVFLEINPNGQYGWVEERTGLSINRAIADALCAAEKT
jgi:glutathione synthase/RimK-type ligase-like ATP-grasp enzyme